MDYGPYFTATIEIEPGNIANKGIAIRLDGGAGGVSQGSEFVLFDTDTLRCAAIWTGQEFIDWRNVALDGQHEVHPSLRGQLMVSNPDAPGWASPAGDFDDKRIVGRDGNHYGPLPRSWSRWKGLYVHGDKVVLSYTIGNAEILEIPGSEGSAGSGLITRTINIGPREKDLALQVARGATHRLEKVVSTIRFFRAFVLLGPSAPTPGSTNIARPAFTAAAALGVIPNAKWVSTKQGDLRLSIPAGSSAVRLKVVCGALAKAGDAAQFKKEVTDLAGPIDLAPFTKGGPAS